MSTSKPVIEMRDVVSLIGDYPVLAGMTFSISAGEVVLLEGPNGAGKTSVLRACSGLLAVKRGSLEVLGIDVVNNHNDLDGVGFLGHENGLYAELTAYENLEFYSRAFRTNKSGIGQALGVMKLNERVSKTRVSKLSAGQRRRIAIAVLLLSKAQIWLLDEPHAGLDKESRDVIDNVINNSAADGKTILFASHERERANALASRVLSINGGCVQGDSAFSDQKEPVRVV